MDIKITKKRFQYSLIWLGSFFLSLGISISFVFGVVDIVTAIYEKKHPVPVGQDDLGLGLIMVFWFSVAFIIAIPLVVLLTILFRKIINKFYMKEKND